LRFIADHGDGEQMTYIDNIDQIKDLANRKSRQERNLFFKKTFYSSPNYFQFQYSFFFSSLISSKETLQKINLIFSCS